MESPFVPAAIALDASQCERTPSSLASIQFHGVVRTKMDALIKEVGHLYTSRNLDELLKNAHLASSHMQEMGLLDKCVPLVDTSAAGPHSYTIDFVVKEPPPVTIGLKMGVNMSGDADGSMTGEKKSVGGRGEFASLSYSNTLKGGHTFDFSASKPVLGWQTRSNFGLSAARNFQHLKWNKSDLMENSLVLFHSGSMFGAESMRRTTRLILAWRQLMPQNDAPFPIKEHAGHTSKISLENALTLLETRDRPVLATRGFFAKLTQEIAGQVGGDSAFFKNQLDLQAAAPLFQGAFVGASLRATTVQSLADRSLHVLDRVYLGGPHDIRGFDISSIGTRADTSCLGGSAGFSAALHLYRPLVPNDMLYLHAFATAGSVCSVRSRSWLRDMMSAPRISTGLGLTFVYGNALRFELNYVMPMKYVPGDLCAPGVQFGVGLNFL